MLRQAVVAATALVACTLAPGQAWAQDKGDVEVFFGVQWFRPSFDDLEPLTGDTGLDMWGIHGDIAFYLGDMLGIVLEGSFPRTDIDLTIPVGDGIGATIDYSQATYLIGPRLRFNREGTVTPSIQAMIGWSSGSIGRTEIEGVDVPVLIDLGDNSFAFGAGANLDLRLGSSFALRLVQASVVMTSFANDSQANLRLAAGIVGRF